MLNHLIILWFRYIRYPWSHMWRFLFEQQYKNAYVAPLASISDVSRILRTVTWTADSWITLFDVISYPETVLVKRKDDCDGFASLAAALLPVGVNPVLLTVMVHPLKYSHTMCVFQGVGGLRVFSNDVLWDTVFQNYREIAINYSNGWKLIAWDVREPLSLKLIEAHTKTT